MSTGKGGGSEDEGVFQNLKSWIEKSDGEVHAALHLKRRTADENSDTESKINHGIRGLFAKTRIQKGEILLKVPTKLVLSGEKLPKKWKDRVASPWLRCLACLYSAQDVPEWEPYLSSLPSEYETLWQWEDDEMKYLDGTTLGETLRADREDGSLVQRYEEYVRPYLRYLKIVGKKDDKGNSDPMHTFRQASMCISTRGFHMRSSNADNVDQPETEIGKEANNAYMGPFLLPMIDLLNHNEFKKATTLQRDHDTGTFYMKAERDIAEGEEIMHSYGDKLTAAQLLQTFGFVPESMIQQSSQDLAGVSNTTPAVFAKKDLVDACMSVKTSSSPKELVQTMKDNQIEGDVWDLDIKDANKRDMSFISDQILVTPSESGSCLSDEIVTLCCIQMLPEDVYKEIFDEEEPKLLGQEVLEDYFLGKLVVLAILTAIKTKLESYTPIRDISGVSEATDDRSILQQLLRLNKPHSSTLRALYGITIRLEEKKALNELRSEAISLLACLDDDDGDDDDEEGDGDDDRPTKKVKTSNE